MVFLKGKVKKLALELLMIFFILDRGKNKDSDEWPLQNSLDQPTSAPLTSC